MQITSFEEWYSNYKNIPEMSIAKSGDAEFPSDLLSFKTKFMLSKDWNFIIVLNNLSLFKQKNSGYYMLGKMNQDDERFEVYLYINLINVDNSFFKQHGYAKCKQVLGVDVKSSNRGDGFATSVYKYFVQEEKFSLLGDKEQYFGARKLWTRLSKELDVKVDIIDIENKKILEKDVILHHGSDDWDFDKRVWSYTPEKKNIRCILTKI